MGKLRLSKIRCLVQIHQLRDVGQTSEPRWLLSGQDKLVGISGEGRAGGRWSEPAVGSPVAG